MVMGAVEVGIVDETNLSPHMSLSAREHAAGDRKQTLDALLLIIDAYMFKMAWYAKDDV